MAGKKPSLTQQLRPQTGGETSTAKAPPEVVNDQPAKASPRKTTQKGGRAGQVNFAAWGPPEGKYAFEEIALQRKRSLGRRVSLQELMYEAFNDFLMKEGRPALFPSKEET